MSFLKTQTVTVETSIALDPRHTYTVLNVSGDTLFVALSSATPNGEDGDSKASLPAKARCVISGVSFVKLATDSGEALVVVCESANSVSVAPAGGAGVSHVYPQSPLYNSGDSENVSISTVDPFSFNPINAGELTLPGIIDNSLPTGYPFFLPQEITFVVTNEPSEAVTTPLKIKFGTPSDDTKYLAETTLDEVTSRGAAQTFSIFLTNHIAYETLRLTVTQDSNAEFHVVAYVRGIVPAMEGGGA